MICSEGVSLGQGWVESWVLYVAVQLDRLFLKVKGLFLTVHILHGGALTPARVTEIPTVRKVPSRMLFQFLTVDTEEEVG